MLDINPFIYDNPLEPADAIVRREEVEHLIALVEGGHNTRLSAPRRYGKTTLLRQVQSRAIDLGYGTIEVDLFGVQSRHDFAVRIDMAYRTMQGPLRRVVDGILGKIKLGLNTPAVGGSVEVESRGPGASEDAALLALLDLPLKLFKRKGVRMLIVFDEFQDVLTAEGSIDAILRSRIQHHGQAATYIFAGSQPGMLAELFGSKSRPLWGQARAIDLGRLPEDDTYRYMQELFARSNRRLGVAAEHLLQLADGHPQRIMMLAHHLWEQTPSEIEAGDAEWDAALQAVFHELEQPLHRTWREHDDEEQKVLRAVAAEYGPLFSIETLEAFALSKATAADARERLIDAGDLALEHHGVLRFVDPLFAAWVAAGQRKPPFSPLLRVPGPDERARTFFGSPYVFGQPDGSRADFTELQRDFVSFEHIDPWAGPAIDVADRRTRVIVGRKGSGKTLYLRRLWAHAATDESLYAAPVAYGAGVTTKAVQDLTRAGVSDTTGLWQRCWHAAIIRSVVEHVLRGPLSVGVSAPRLESLEVASREVAPLRRSPRSIPDVVRQVIDEHPRVPSLERYLANPVWQDVEYELEPVLAELPPLCFYLDALDEQFEEAPSAWLSCQKGLFFAVMRLLREYRFGGRLHVVVAIRDVVYGSVLESEHASRYRDDPYVRPLDWDDRSLSYFMHEKIRRLPRSHRLQPDDEDPVRGWLGMNVVTNRTRDRAEDVAEYLLRHTRRSPRDVVSLGNALCAEVFRSRNAGRPFLTDDTLRITVSDAATHFGLEQLSICGNHVAAEIPMQFAEQDIGIGQAMAAHLTERLRELNVDRISSERLDVWLDDVAPALGVNLDTILWQNGVLGYNDPSSEETVFFRSLRNEFALPRDVQTYAVHPVVVDALAYQNPPPRASR
jgi:hypothetical protein